MAIYKLNTKINSGKFKGEKVSDLIKSSDGIEYLINLHNGKYNVKLNGDVLSLMEDKIVYLDNGKLLNKAEIRIGILFHEHCPFKNEPCDYFGRGWYDRCASCKHHNGFVRKNEDKSKPF